MEERKGFAHIMNIFGDKGFKTITFMDPEDNNVKGCTIVITDSDDNKIAIKLNESDIINVKSMLDFYLHRSIR